MEQKKLIMTFKNILGNSFSISIEDPRADLQETDVLTTMELILEKNIFQPKGYDLASLVSAKIVDSTTTDFDLTV